MMNSPSRMSPLTAFFIGLFGLGTAGIVAGTVIVLSGMQLVDTKAATVLAMAEETVGKLPDLIQSLPPVIEKVLHDRRAPDYVKNVEVKVDFTAARSGGVVPALTITNRGNEVISLLAIRVAALDERKVPLREWTEVVATPLALQEDWRGPMLPHATRHVVLAGRLQTDAPQSVNLTGAVEVADVRIWQAEEGVIRSASAAP